MNIGKTIIIGTAVVIIIFVIAMLALGLGTKAQELGTQQRTTDEVQNVNVRMQGYQYILSPSTLKVGVPARMEIDLKTVTGCMRSIVIPAFNVRQQVSDADNVIMFTPDRTGTIQMSCSMGMGQGSFDVIDDGSGSFEQVSPTTTSQGATTQQAKAGGSCGTAGRGCGCGMR
ncbi:MAG: hypothetical protein V1743_08105 [Nanoarchaeota archaeon]